MIQCGQTEQMYGKDIFFVANVVPGGSVNQGDQVRFSIKMEAKGPAAASMTRLVAASPGYGAPIPAYGAPVAAPVPMSAGNFVGTIKSFNKEKGWGMIQCGQTEQMYGKDIFFVANVVPGGSVNQGDQVRFSIKMEAKGPAAASMARIGAGSGPMAMAPRSYAPQPVASYAPIPSYAPVPSYAPPVFRGGMMPNQMGHGAPQRMPPADQLFFGSVRAWSAEKGYGHISCEAANALFGKDVFLLRGVLPVVSEAVELGMLMSFQVNPSPKGPQAASVSLLPAGSFATEEGQEASMFTGTVKSFNEEKGWGFLEDPELKELFGKDIFFHKRELDGQSPSNGDEIQFTVAIDAKGGPAAKNCTLVDSQGLAPSGKGARYAPY